MTFEVTAGTWPVKGRVFNRGETVDRTELARLIGEHRIQSSVRLGFITEQTVGLPKLKKDLHALAVERGVEVPDGALKDDISALLEEQ